MSSEFTHRDFAHLHLHTDYSLLQSTIQLKPLAAYLKTQNIESCAITDFGNLYGAVSFYRTMKAEGLHPIIGYEAFVTFGSRFEQSASLQAGERPYYNVVLLAKNWEGYHNLIYLASKAFTEGFHYKPRIDLDLLAEKSSGLIGLSTGLNGPVGHFLKHQNFEKAEVNARLFEEILGRGNFFLEIQDHQLAEEKNINRPLVELSRKTEIELVAANEAFYLTKDDARAHEILMCIGETKTINDGTRTILGSPNFYVRTKEEMWELFGRDLPESLRNTIKVAEMCAVEFPKGSNLALPDFPIPENAQCATTDEYFEKVVLEGFEERRRRIWSKQLTEGKLKYTLENYRTRVQTEIETIREMKFPGYFLIVWEFIRFARERQIPVGPGRGSAAGSLVAFCLGITDVDPLQYDLLFERFLNPERVSMPDIDIDFCVRGRAEVINHVTEFYGRESVCQIITFGTLASKAAIKDVGRALSMPYGEVEKIGKLIPPPVRGRNISITQALEQVSDLRQAIETSPEVRDLIDLARRLEGCSRHSSVHAAGVVISPRPLHELVPVALSAKSELTSQFSMGDLEKVGMLKMDFLALTTLTIINDCLKSIKHKTGDDIDWSLIPLDDHKTMALFGEGRTEAIFQFESSGMQEICRRLKPKELEDLSALNALYRPGPLDGGMVDDFIARHRGEKKVQYIVPEMKEILQNTYGILVYQEQIMQLAQKLGGYTLGEADMMRRAMGKKNREEMAEHRSKFVEGAVSRNIKQLKAEEIFNLMAQFADYGFNRSHSVAYAILAYQTAYLKAHFAAYFYAAVLSNESADAAKIYKYSNELRSGGLKLLPPDVNESDADFTPLENGVRFGLNAIKGIGSASVQSIINARRDDKFTSLYDFTSRLEQGSIGRRGLESLITAGAFDSMVSSESSIHLWRARLFAGIEGAIGQGQKIWTDQMSGQNALFTVQDSLETILQKDLPVVRAWTQSELSQQEKASVGFYLSTHPLDVFADTLKSLKIPNIADRSDLKAGDKIIIAGIVSGFQVRHSKKGNRFCLFRFEDRTVGVKCLAWADTFSKYSECLRDEQLLIIDGKVESSEGQEITLIVEQARFIADAVPLKAREISITLPEGKFDEDFLEDLFALLSSHRGPCEVLLGFRLDPDVLLQIHSQPLRVQGSSRLEADLKERGCQVKWNL